MENDLREVDVPADGEKTTVDDDAIHNAAQPSAMSIDLRTMQGNHRIPWVGVVPATAVMAVVDDDGYLIPLCTSADLLRAFKTIWRATKD